jgi:hypothetical protein
MKAGVWNLLFGLLAVGLGLSGRFVLLGMSGPNGSTALVVVGGILAAWGAIQLARSRGQRQ